MHPSIDTPPSSTFGSSGNAWNECIVTWNAAVPGIVAAWAGRGMRITFVPMYGEVKMCGLAGDDHDLCGASRDREMHALRSEQLQTADTVALIRCSGSERRDAAPIDACSYPLALM